MTEEELESTKQRILKEAATIVSKSSISELSMRVLAQRVGLTPGALYRYFPSKQGMLYAYWHNALQELGARIADISSVERDPLKAIRGMLLTYTNFCLDDHDRFRLIFLENDQTLAVTYMQQSGGLAPYDMLLSRVIEAMDQGIFVRRDPDLIAQALWASAHGAVTLLITIVEMPMSDPYTLINTTIGAMMRGLVIKEL